MSKLKITNIILIYSLFFWLLKYIVVIGKKVCILKKSCCYRSEFEGDITYNQMQKILRDKLAIVIDVRSKQEFNEGHINGAINIPLSDINKLTNMVKDKKKYIILYCSSGIRSKKAQKELISKGYINVYNLIDGF